MEKKYIKPTSKVVFIGSETLMAGSVDKNDNMGNGVQLGKENNSEWED